jgi:hypothetical protein
MNKLLKSALKTAVYLLEQSDRVSADIRDRVADGVDRASGRVSGLRARAQNLYGREDHTVRNVVSFAAGLGLGVGAAMLFAPASGKEIRNSIGEKVQDIGDRVRDRFSPEVAKASCGTEGP